MRKQFLAGVAFTAVALAGSAAFAADPIFAPAPVAPAPVAPAPVVYNWTGPYIGAHIGYGWGKHRHRGFRTGAEDTVLNVENFQTNGLDLDDLDADFADAFGLFPPPIWRQPGLFPAGVDPDDFDVAFNELTIEQTVFFNETRDDLSGWFAGVQAGYNFMMTPNFLVGVEADFSWSGIDGNHRLHERWERDYDLDGLVVDGVPLGDFAAAETFNIHTNATTDIDWFGTFRARLGVPMDAILPYVTGGLAWGRVSSSGTVVANGEGAVFGPGGGLPIATWDDDVFVGSFSSRDTRVGWSLGAGIEAGLTQNVSVKAEYLYVDLGSKTHTHLINDVAFNHRERVNFHTVKLGLNWRFATGGMGVAY